ncbi:hypothetical protein E4U40_006144 [Claviceps sp. LM458 group G5]|nr:hypothetical protein E4U40_006144 [Claviceps sp. LM458 group G5]
MAANAQVDAPQASDTDVMALSPNDSAQLQNTASQVTLPTTEEGPPSPMDTDQSFRTELNDDRQESTVIPSSLTPPSFGHPHADAHSETVVRTLSQSQSQSQSQLQIEQTSALCSPPATILKTLRERETGTEYCPPVPHQIMNASVDELRFMLQTCIAEQQKLKMETAHFKLQYNLLSLQSEDDVKRSLVEHEMMRREVEALRTAEHSRQARRDLSTAPDSMQSKYLQMKQWYEAAMEENERLHHRLKVAKKVIQQKEDETTHLEEERDILLTRIRENREHLHMLCGPGGIFHSAMTPKPEKGSSSTAQQSRASHQKLPPQYHYHTTRSSQRERAAERDENYTGRDGGPQREHVNGGREHGLSALLQAMSQSQSQPLDQNISAPSTPATPHRSVPNRQPGRHQRNAQSMSSLPTTPVHWSRRGGDATGTGLLPSVDLVPQTEPPRPRHQYTTPVSSRGQRAKSRESTISVDDNEELARQALESVGEYASRALASHAGKAPQEDEGGDDGEVFEGQPQARQATEGGQGVEDSLRRHHPARRSLVMGRPEGCRDGSPRPAEQSIRLQAKLWESDVRSGGEVSDNKNWGSGRAAAERAVAEDILREQSQQSQRGQGSQLGGQLGSPAKRVRTGGEQSEETRVGLGIQYK